MGDGITVKVNMASLNRVKQSLNNQGLIRQKCAKKIVAKYLLLIDRDAKMELANDPRRIDTGLLRNSIKVLLVGLAGRVFTDTEYASFVHWGTGIHGENPEGGHRTTPWVYFDEKTRTFRITTGMEPNKFLQIAWDNHVAAYVAELKVCFGKSDTSLAK